MRLIFGLLVAALLVAGLFSTATKAQKLDGKFSDILAGNKITGEWRINYAESDNPISKMQSLLQNKTAQFSNEKNTDAENNALPTMSVSLALPETLSLAGDDSQSITINEGFSRVVFTRTLATDGKLRVGELQNGANFFIAATQTNNSLKIEIVSPRGNKMTENYALENEGKKLLVTVRFETAQGSEMMTLRRVYDRAILDVSLDGAEQIQ